LEYIFDIPKPEEYEIYYDDGIPHPYLDVIDIKDLISIESREPNEIDFDWYNSYNEVLLYELLEGVVYIDVTDEFIKLEPYEDWGHDELRNSFNKQLKIDIKEKINNKNVDIYNPHKEIFDTSLLYPIFYNQPDEEILFWNIIADYILTRSLIDEPIPDIRTECEKINFTAFDASNSHLRILRTLDYEIPYIGKTKEYIISNGNFKNVDSLYINWDGARDIPELDESMRLWED
jgi:hypothetical protein